MHNTSIRRRSVLKAGAAALSPLLGLPLLNVVN